MGESTVLTAVPSAVALSPWVRANEIAGELNRLYAALVSVTASVIAADDWGAHGGVRSPEHWLSLRAGLAPATAGQVVAIARRVPNLPRTIALLDEGQLSLDQAAVIARHVPASYEASVVELAPKLTVAQLRRALSRYPFDSAAVADASAGGEGSTGAGTEGGVGSDGDSGRPIAEDAIDADRAGDIDRADGDLADAGLRDAGRGVAGRNERIDDAPAGATSAFGGLGHAADEVEPELSESAARAGLPGRLTTWWDRGRFHIRGDLPADLGALLEQALKEAKDALFTAGATTAGPADALAEIANRSLATVEPVSRADRYRVYLHLDSEGAWLNGRGAIPRHLADRYACTSTHAVVLERDGLPVSVGRTQRAIPARTRRLVEDRDRGCAYPGCTATRFVEIHHLEHWEDGGGTDYDNLVCLCPHHHTGHHQGAFTITPAPAPVPVLATGGDARDGSGSRMRVGRDGLSHFTFRDNRGRPIHVQPPPRRAGPGSDAATGPERGEPAILGTPTSEAAGATYAGPLGERLDLGWVRFYRDTDPFRPLRRTRSSETEPSPGDVASPGGELVNGDVSSAPIDDRARAAS